MKIPIKTYLESVPGFFGIRVEEEPSYDVIQTDEASGFEVRQYHPTVQAQTLVEGQRREAVDEAFRRLAGYIFGENSAGKKYSMTTPVLQTREQMSMTTPVLQQKQAGGWLVSFILPSDVTLETAPKPIDSRIKIVRVQSKLVATLRYSGNVTDQKAQVKADELLAITKRTGLKIKSAVTLAQYDQPLAIPFLKRNEAQVEIEDVFTPTHRN